MAIQAIRTSNGSTAFGQESGSLGPAFAYYHSSVRPDITGSIDTTTGSDAVTGTGTFFTTQLQAGNYILTAGGNLYQIKSITNNTALVLMTNATATETAVTAKPFFTVFLGKTHAITMTDNQTFSPITFSQTGTNPQNMVETGFEATVNIEIAEASIERLTQIFDHIRGQRNAVSGNVEGYYRRLSIGNDHASYFDRLTVVKVRGGADSTLASERITFLRTAPIFNLTATYNSTDQHIVTASFQCYASDYVDANGSSLVWYSGTLSGVTTSAGVAVPNLDTAYP